MSIRVIAKDVGGAFGLKNHPWREEMSVIVGALLLGRPLKWIEDRCENLIAANQAREQEMTVRIGFDKDGKLLASHSDYSLNNGAYPQGADANIAVHMFMWAAYKMPAPGFYTRGWYTNTVGLGCLSRALGDGVAGARDHARHGGAGNRHRSDRDPPAQSDYQSRPAVHYAAGDSARRHHSGRMPGEAAHR